MTTISNHKKRIAEHLEELQEAVEKNITSRAATIGFHASACAFDLLETYLHKKKLLEEEGEKVE
ncbi:hypothetical protein HY483_01035 [Candidatus Woesearchaeota archaeon]|nr:hypothetical protein [Candidatus Woesearchaeota archaeon]